jgi:hypothetical protein
MVAPRKPRVPRLVLRLDYEGASVAGLTWRELRDLVDAFTAAVGEMPQHPDVAHVIPIGLKEGSVAVELAMPAETRRVALALARGPTRSWAPETHRTAEGLYQIFRSKGATVTLGQRKFHPFVVPDVGDTWYVTERTTMLGEVRRVGGAKGRAEVTFGLDGRITCDAGRERAAELGKHLYQRAYFTGVARRDISSGTLVSFSIEAFDPIDPVPVAELPARLAALIGDEMEDFDVDAYLREHRG